MLNSQSKILSWDNDRADICDKILSTQATLKILLKTKDDLFFINEWISHHRKIVGSANLYVFDNASTDPALLEYYRSIEADISVFQFTGFHNDIHDDTKYSELYDAIRASCDFFTFLDTDERLVLVKNSQWYCDGEIIGFLNKHKSAPIIPAAWLANIPGSREIFFFGEKIDDLTFGLTNGKPVLSADANAHGFLNHNIDASSALDGSEPPLNLFILHLNKLSAEQRIRSNLNKLKARNIVHSNITIDELLLIDTSNIVDENSLDYIEEIRLLYQTDEIDVVAELQPGHLRFAKSGHIEFFSESDSALFQRYLGSDVDIIVSKSERSLTITVDRKIFSDYRGYIEVCNQNLIQGWATDAQGNPSWIHIHINNDLKISLFTKQSRIDLQNVGIGKGLGGFKINISGLLDAGMNTIHIVHDDGHTVANGSYVFNNPETVKGVDL